jgi:predicted nucleic acid-binding protein
MNVDRAAEAIEDYLDIPIVRHGHTGLVTSILRLRQNFSAYDAAYVALAASLGAVLLSADRALRRAAWRHARIPTA